MAKRTQGDDGERRRDRGPELAGVYTRVSGLGKDACVALAGRYEAELGYRPPDIETWVVAKTPGRLNTTFAKQGWLTGIWRSESETVYVSDMASAIHHRTSDPSVSGFEAWTTHVAIGNMTGIWGLSDAYVMAWGSGPKRSPCMMLWEGTSWREIDAPAFQVSAVHGTSPELIFAAGESGRIARWDGMQWTETPTPADGTLASVFCVDADEVYACGWDHRLLRGTTAGWTEVLRAETSLHCVVKWRGDVWVGGALPLGLCKLSDDALVQVKPKLQMMDADVRGHLLFTTNTSIIHTETGERWLGNPVKDFMHAVRNDPPSWR